MADVALKEACARGTLAIRAGEKGGEVGGVIETADVRVAVMHDDVLMATVREAQLQEEWVAKVGQRFIQQRL
jgi:hypothetical protein